MEQSASGIGFHYRPMMANSNYKTEAQVQAAIASFLEFGDFDLDG